MKSRIAFLKQLSYSVSGAILLTALSMVFDSMGGEVLTVPGIILEGWINLLIISISKDAYFSLSNWWPVFNVLVYSLMIFLILSVVKRIRSTS